MTRHATRLPQLIALLGCFAALVGLVLSARPLVPLSSPVTNSADGPSTLTDAQGRFRFDGLRSSSHVLRVDTATLPPGIQAPSEPAALTVSPGVTQALAVAPDVTLLATYHDDGATIAGTLFRDYDGDRVQGPDEPGLSGVRIIDPDIYQYFVPFNDDNLYRSFVDAVQPAICVTPPPGSQPSNTIDSTISLVASSDNTTIYYDDWEDGYDADPTNPAPGSTTVVYPNPTNPVINAGSVLTLQNDIPIPRVQNNFFRDGRDRITVIGLPASAVRAAWVDGFPGPLLAGAWEMSRVSDWGRRYVVPVGEDLGAPADFDYVDLEVMAAYDGTTVQIDADADDVFETTKVIDAGETVIVPDPQQNIRVQSGAKINATLPVQVQVRGGHCRANYSGRSYTLVPVERWSSDYWSPVSGFINQPNACNIRFDGRFPANLAVVDIYIHNPNSTDLAVNYEDASGAGVITIPADSTSSYLSLRPGYVPSNTQGVHLFSASNQPFWAVTAVDSTSNGNRGVDFDWSYALVPGGSLSARAVVSWAPAYDEMTGPTQNVNGSTVYVQAVEDNTLVRVDLDGDDVYDAFDTDGDRMPNNPSNYGYNEVNSAAGITLMRGQMLRISHPGPDRDMAGAIISSQDNDHPLAVVYGEDACVSDYRAPYLDLGYTILPLPIPEFNKTANLHIDTDRSGDESPGDILSYKVVAHNNGTTAIENPVIVDTLPYTYTDLVVGSIQSTQPPTLSMLDPTYDDGSNTFTAPASPQIHAFKLSYDGNLQPEETITVIFQARLDARIPFDISSVTNNATLSSDNTPTVTTQVTTPINQVDLLIHKTDHLLTVEPGQVITYTLTYTNAGPGIARNVVMTDTLPPTALNVSAPAVPGVITPTIEPGRVIFQLGTMIAGQVGQTTISLTLAPNTPRTGTVVNTVVISTTSHEPNKSNNFSEDIDRIPPLAITLAELRAERLPGGVLVRWRTAAELDNYGFQVYRSTTPGRAGAVLVTPAVIPGQGRGHSGGASYSFFDAGAPDGPLYYWLEDIDLNGTSTFHGPATATLQAVRFTWFLPVVRGSR